MMKESCGRITCPGSPKLIETAQDLGVKMIACTTTLGLLGISKETLIDGVDNSPSLDLPRGSQKTAQ